jgi:hypothetical protein
MKKAVFLIAILFGCIFNALAQEKIEAEEYEIYSLWLEKRAIIGESKEIILIKSTTDHWDDFKDLPSHRRRELSKLKSSTLKDYRLRNRKLPELENNFNVNANVHLISDSWLNFSVFKTDYGDFVKKSGAEFVIAFSRVGFNKKKTQALLHVLFKSISVSKFDFGYYFLFSKEKDNWVIKQRGKSWEF